MSEQIKDGGPTGVIAVRDDELPGMWSNSDFTGGDPDERSHAVRSDVMGGEVNVLAVHGGYGVIVCDPPWAYGRDTGRTRTAEHHYKTLGNNGGEINRKTGAGLTPFQRERGAIRARD